MKVRLKHITQDKDRHGNVRTYYRAPGKSKIRLRSEVGSDAFMEEYRCAEAGIPYVEPGKKAPVLKTKLKHDEASLSWLSDQFLRRSVGRLSDHTLYRRGRMLGRICALYGAARYKDLTTKELVRIRDELVQTNGAKNNVIEAIGSLYSWANEVHLANFNPAHGIKDLYSGDGIPAWTVDDVRAFVKHHPKGTKPYRALVIFLFTGLRVGDVSRLSWDNVTPDRRIQIMPTKTIRSSGAKVDIPILPALAEEIDKTPRDQPAFMLTDYGKPFSHKSFGMKFARWCHRAGLHNRSAHGLRKIGATLAAELGASEYQLMAIYGWTTRGQAAHYTKTVNRRRLSDQGMSLITTAWDHILSAPPSAAENAAGQSGQIRP